MGKLLDKLAESALPPREYRASVLAEKLDSKALKGASDVYYTYPRSEQSKQAKQTEQTIKKQIRDWAKAKNYWCYSAQPFIAGPDGKLRSHHPGVPDLLLCVEGRFLAVEVKTGVKNPKISRKQINNLAHIARCAGHAIVVCSTNDFFDYLHETDWLENTPTKRVEHDLTYWLKQKAGEQNDGS